MKKILFILFGIALLNPVFSQKKSPFKLNPFGFITSIDIAKGGKTYIITNLGSLYSTDSIEGIWRETHFTWQSETKPTKQSLALIKFFDQNHGVIFGHIINPKTGISNAYYYTSDGGKSWNLKTLPNEMQSKSLSSFSPPNTFLAKNLQLNDDGHGWFLLNYQIFETKNFGLTWNLTQAKFGKNGVNKLSMGEGGNGLAIGYKKGFITTDGWKTSNSISLPMKELKIKEESQKVSELLYWNDKWIMRQGKHLFLSGSKNIRWKEIPSSAINISAYENKLIGFEGDRYKQFGITSIKDYKIVVFDLASESWKPISSVILDEGTSSFYGGDSKGFYWFNSKKKGFQKVSWDGNYSQHSIMLTGGIRKRMKEFITDHKDSFWGYSGFALYWSEDGNKWFLQKELDFIPTNIGFRTGKITLQNKSKNYEYNISSDLLRLTVLQNPLKKFLSSDISSVNVLLTYKPKILSDTKYSLSSSFTRQANKLMSESIVANEKVTERMYELPIDSIRFRLELLNQLEKTKINSDYFGFSKKEKEDLLEGYKAMPKPQIELFKTIHPNFSIEKSEKILNNIDTLSAITWHKILKSMQYEENEMFRKGIFQVEIVNSNSEILTLFCHFSSKNETIYYPMIAEYEGITFNCQDFILSNYFTNALMPNPYPKDIYNKIILDRAVRTLSGSFADTLKEKILKKEKIGND